MVFPHLSTANDTFSGTFGEKPGEFIAYHDQKFNTFAISND
jgi:hypothetical protein